MNAPDGGIQSEASPQVRTLLLTDLCDSTTLVERLGDTAAAELFRAHDRLVLKLQQQWHGRLIDRSDGLLLVDCDRFKGINDEHGHLVGDRVLQGVANILRSAAGVDDIACRLGGDEFCLLVGAERQGDIVRIAQFVVDTAQALHKLQPSPPQITTLSIGASPVSPDQSWDDWYANADAALYRAKRLGGNRVEWQDDALAPV